MPAVEVGLGKSPAKNWTVATTNPTISITSTSAPTSQYWTKSQLHTDSFHQDPRQRKKVWQYHLVFGRYIQNEVWVTSVLSCSEKHWLFSCGTIRNCRPKNKLAPSILSSWNAKWQSPYFMTNYSEAEMGSIATVFPTGQLWFPEGAVMRAVD